MNPPKGYVPGTRLAFFACEHAMELARHDGDLVQWHRLKVPVVARVRPARQQIRSTVGVFSRLFRSHDTSPGPDEKRFVSLILLCNDCHTLAATTLTYDRLEGPYFAREVEPEGSILGDAQAWDSVHPDELPPATETASAPVKAEEPAPIVLSTAVEDARSTAPKTENESSPEEDRSS